MKFCISALLCSLVISAWCSARPSAEADEIALKLEAFLPTGETRQRISLLVDQLDSESYKVRAAAYQKLSDLPTLPGFVRQRVKLEKKPEIRARLIHLTKQFSIDRENDSLNKVLSQIIEYRTKGTLGQLSSILRLNVWIPNNNLLQQAARATVTPKDLALIKKSMASDSIAVRRLMASALAALPPKEASPLLEKLLADPSDRVAIIAALSLAEQGNKACLKTFARLLESEDFFTRHQSWSALKSMSGKSFGYSPTAPAARRQPAIEQWKRWAAQAPAGLPGTLSNNSSIVLFNGTDLAGWAVYENGKPAPQQTSWIVRDQQLLCLGVNQGDLRTKERFENYVLTLDYKIEQGRGDGGIGVMLTKENEIEGPGPRGDAGSYLEVQLLPGKGGDLYSIGNFKAKVEGKDLEFSKSRMANIDDRSGAWHQLKLVVSNGDLKVEINGKLVNEATQGSKGPGRIVIRNEGDRITFKNILLLPLQP